MGPSGLKIQEIRFTPVLSQMRTPSAPHIHLGTTFSSRGVVDRWVRDGVRPGQEGITGSCEKFSADGRKWPGSSGAAGPRFPGGGVPSMNRVTF
ncbi:hypothetical protein GCM10009678_33600 [Actinomadura kijaniata]